MERLKNVLVAIEQMRLAEFLFWGLLGFVLGTALGLLQNGLLLR